MASDLHSAPEASLALLLGGVINDLQLLIKQEAALARREFADQMRKTKEAALSLGIGIGIAALGGGLLILMIVHLLSWAVPSIPLWGSYGIVGAVLAGAGAILLLKGKSKAEEIQLVPPQTAETIKENLQWITKRT
jgi:Putative Actinobacterial Holin-X, holin superfamily III